MATKEFIVAIELGSSKVTGIAGQKNLDGSINVLAVVKEESSSFIRRGVAYNIDKTALCIANIVKKLTNQLKTEITKVYVGVGGQSIRSVRNVISKDLPADTKVTEQMVIDLMDANDAIKYSDQEKLSHVIQEYKVDSQYQIDPVGIQCSHLEGNFLNILQRYTFYKNLNKCFENAGVNVAEMFRKASEKETTNEKIEYLKETNREIVETIVNALYNEKIKYYKIDITGYKAYNDFEPWSTLQKELRYLYLFQKGNVTADNLTTEKRNQLLLQSLERMDKDEAKIMIGILNRTLSIAGWSKKVLVDNFMKGK